MPYLRDPLSVRYDPQARLVLKLAIDQHEKRTRNRRLVAHVTVRIPNPVTQSLVRDQGGLSQSERAFQRALYHDPRVRKPRKNSSGEWSLKCDWDPAPVLPGMQRNLRVTVFREHEAAAWAARRLPRSEQWQHNERLQSGGIGSGKERFG